MAERERPILFSGPMVRALLDGRKTQTRRIINDDWWRCLDPEDAEDRNQALAQCPYGQPGDRLWVRETWWNAEGYPGSYPSGEPMPPSRSRLVHYAANGDPPDTPNRYYPNGLRGRGFAAPEPWARWKQWPSIHMPRWASRLTLEVTGVRVERLQDISESDARAEGVARNTAQEGTWLDYPAGTSAAGWKDPQRSFQSLWETINGPDSWAANPWVWVVEFRRVEAAR